MNTKLIKMLNESLEIQLMAKDIGTEEAKAKADETWAMAMKVVGDTAKSLETAVKLMEQVNGRFEVQS
jgi:lipopolysaccharide export system protein LptC|tara:strand:+ start:302 stop:505 length:204 start_codon:yes stop_codon:yes gene_type:complete